MDSNVETFGSWHGYARPGAVTLVPTTPFTQTTGLSAAVVTAAVVIDAANAGFGRPQAMRTHKSITRPGSPPRGRLR